MNRPAAAFLLVSFWLPSLLRAAGSTGAAFLDIPVGAGPAAQGTAYTAAASDAYAPVYNPAGLGFLEMPQLAGQHLAYLESIHYEQLSYVHPLSHGHGLGVSAQYLGSGDIVSRDEQGAETGSHSSNYGVYSLAYGKTLGNAMALGLTGKWIHSRLEDVSASAYAFDLGVMAAPARKLRVGATLVNMGTKLKFINEGDSLPLGAHAGAAWDVSPRWRISPELVWSKGNDVSARIGGQWQPIPSLALRAGYRTDTLKELSALAGFSTGIGVFLWGHELSYAWVPYGPLGNSQYVSLVLRFGQGERQKKNLIQYSKTKQPSVAQQPAPDPEGDQLKQLLREEDTRHRVGQGKQ